MKHLKLAGIVAATAALLSVAATAGTHESNKIVLDKNEKQVVSTNGNCVITKWNATSDACGLELTRELRTVYFDFNRSTLNSKERAELDKVAKILKGSSHVDSIDIVGFADKIGDSGYNQRLSKKRANTVKAYLARKGLRTRNVGVEGLGEVADEKCEDATGNELISCLAEDRRVEIRLNLKR